MTTAQPRTIKAAFVAPIDAVSRVYGHQRWQRIAGQAALFPSVIEPDKLDAALEQIGETEVIFSTWDMPRLTAAQIDRLPCLRALFYAAGSVRQFARPLLERGILVTSAWQANAIPVAEFALAQILLACKGYWRNTREYAVVENHEQAFRGPGNYGETVALLGMGAIGRGLTERLRPFRLHVLVFDPFLSTADAASLGVEIVSREEAFARGFVVSNHLADNDQTAGMIDGTLLARLRPGATFLNTGRGRTVVEADLTALLRMRPDLTALLDVTDPEPLPLDSPLRSLPNVVVSGHIAGSIGNEVRRLADSAIDEFERYARGEPPQHAVTLKMLATMA